MEWHIGSAILAVIISLHVACGGGKEAMGGMPVRLVPAYTSGNEVYYLEEASTRVPMVLDVDRMGLGDSFRDARLAGTGASSPFYLSKISSDVSFKLELIAKDGTPRTVTVMTAPPDFPPCTIEHLGDAMPGDIYLGTFSGIGPGVSYNLILSDDLTPSYYRQFDHSVFGFKKIINPDGASRFVFVDAPIVSFPKTIGVALGDLVMLDQNFKEIRRAQLLPTQNHGSLPVENHDFYIFDDDHYVLSTCVEKVVDLRSQGGKADSRIAVSILQEIKNDSVVWEWDSSNYPQFYKASTDGNDYLNSNPSFPIADYVHFNSIEYDPSDRGYILSFRHLDSLIKILPFAPPGPNGNIAIKWVLGGRLNEFEPPLPPPFYHQHMARIVSRNADELTLSLFNNNNNHYSEASSSVMVLNVDEKAKKVALIDQYAEPVNSIAMGSSQWFGPDRFFVNWGTSNLITEHDQVQTLSIRFPAGTNVYRAYKIR